MNGSIPEATAASVHGPVVTPSQRAAAVVPRLVRLLKETMGEGCPLKQLSMTQVNAIGSLLRDPGQTLTGLATELGVALGTASETVDRLVELEMVERETNPANRRQVRLSLTPAAAAMAHDIRGRRVEQLDEVFAGLTDEEAAGFLRGLDRWVEVLRHRVDAPAAAAAPRKA